MISMTIFNPQLIYLVCGGLIAVLVLVIVLLFFLIGKVK